MIHTASHIKQGFQEQYQLLRKREGRIYSDTQLAELPNVSPDHPHYREWQMRKESTRRLLNYIERKSSLVRILEIGCGNGWLSNKLAHTGNTEVTGTDVNFSELQQAARVFSHVSNLKFEFGGLEATNIQRERYDFILFAASIQYFESLEKVIAHCFSLLKPSGEIHIIDSPFYRQSEMEAARQRTRIYYESTGVGEMLHYYFHHSLESLYSFSAETLYSYSFLNRVIKNRKNPFPWFVIRAKK